MADTKKRGESVMSGSKPKPKTKKKKAGKKPVHEMNIRHAANGGFIAKHSFKPSPEDAAPQDEEHAIPDMDALHQHMDDHMSMPPPAAPPVSPSPGAAMGGV